MTRKRLEVEIVADADPVVAELREVTRATEDTTDKLDSFGKGAKAAFGALAATEVLSFAKDMLALGATMAATERRADTVFGHMAGYAREWAEANDEAFGTSTNQLLGMQAAVGDLLVPMGIARNEALTMSQGILETANALSEWTGGTRTAAEASEIITKAILGERDGLVELGIKISEADVQRQLAIDGTKNLTGEALIQAEALATLELIQQRGADALTAYAEGADEATAAQKELNSAWQNLKEDTASSLAEPLTGIAKALSSTLEWLDKTNTASEEFVAQNISWSRAARDAASATDQLGNSTKSLGDKAEEYVDAAGRMTRESLGRQEDAVRTVNSEFRSYERTLYDVITAQNALADPAFGAANAVRRLEDAQKNYNDVLKDSESTQADVQDAAIRLAEAQSGLEVAFARVRTEGGQDAIDAFEEMLRSAGVAESVIRDLIASIDEYNNTPVSRKSFQNSDGTRTIGSTKAQAGGGTNEPGDVTLVGEAGAELVRFGRDARVFSASDTRRILAGSDTRRSQPVQAVAGTVTIQNLHVSITGTMDLTNPSSMRDIARRLKAELEDLWRGES